MMSKVIRLFVLVTGVSLIMAVSSIADPAVVIKNDGSCLMAGVDAEGNPILGSFGQIVSMVGNDNKAMIVCKGEVPNESGKETEFSGFPCGVDDPQEGKVYFTTDSRDVITPEGISTLICTFKKEKD